MSQLINPGPSDVWVFMDEAPDSINDASMYNIQTARAHSLAQRMVATGLTFHPAFTTAAAH